MNAQKKLFNRILGSFICLVFFIFFVTTPSFGLAAFPYKSYKELKWRQLINKADKLYDKGDYDEGMIVAQEAVKTAEKNFGVSDVKEAYSIYILGRFQLAKKMIKDAEVSLKHAFTIAEKDTSYFGVTTTVNVLNDLGMLYRKQNRYKEAEWIFKQGIRHVEKTLWANDRSVIILMDNLAALYADLGRYKEAEKLHDKVSAISKRGLDFSKRDAIISEINKARVHLETGRYKEAEQIYLKSLYALEEFNPDDPVISTILANLGELYRRQGRYADAELYNLRALKLKEKELGATHPEVAKSLINLGATSRRQGKYYAAIEYYKRAVPIFESLSVKDNLAITLNNLGTAYRKAGQYKEAEDAYLRSFDIFKEIYGLEHHDVARSLNNIAELYRAQKRFNEAKKLYEQALSIRIKVFGEEHPDTADTLNNFADWWRQKSMLMIEIKEKQKGIAESKKLCEKALMVRIKALGKEHPDVAESLASLGEVYLIEGDLLKAEKLHKEALAIRNKALGTIHPEVADSMEMLSNVYFKEKKFPEARELYEKALNIKEKIFGANHPFLIKVLEGLIECHMKLGEKNKSHIIKLRLEKISRK